MCVVYVLHLSKYKMRNFFHVSLSEKMGYLVIPLKFKNILVRYLSDNWVSSYIWVNAVYTLSVSCTFLIKPTVSSGLGQQLAMNWMVEGLIPGGGQIFRTCPDWPSGLPSLMCNEYQVSFPGVK